QVLYRPDRGSLRHREHPASRLARRFAELELPHFMHFRIVLLNPIVTGDAAIQVAMLYVTADFLRADQADLQFLIIHVRNVRTAADLDIESGLGHLFDGGFLETALRQPKT